MAKRNVPGVDCAQLTSVVLYNTAPKRTSKILPGVYNVERIISRRNFNNVSEKMYYLVLFSLNSHILIMRALKADNYSVFI